MWTFVIPNSIIALSYLLIPVAIGILMLLNPHLPHRWIALLFIAFILACGLTHAMHIVDYLAGSPHSPLAASILSDWACAVLSIMTAVAMALYINRLQGFLIMVAQRDA